MQLKIGSHVVVVFLDRLLRGEHFVLARQIAVRKFPRGRRVITGRIRLCHEQAATKDEGTKELLHESNPRVMDLEWGAIYSQKWGQDPIS